jgi:hypothetical protein
MQRITFFVGVLLFAACQAEGVDSGDVGATGPARGTTPIVVVAQDDAQAKPDMQAIDPLLVPSPDTQPAKDTLNLDAMTRAERCATGNPAIYTYGWATACADLAAWTVQNPNRAGDTTAPIQRGNNEDCAWTYCGVTR